MKSIYRASYLALALILAAISFCYSQSLNVFDPDTSAFSLVSGLSKYDVTPSTTHYTEFRFVPNRLGVHTAQVVILTQKELSHILLM